MSDHELTRAVREAVDPTTLMERVADRTLHLLPAAQGVAIGLLSGPVVTYVCGAGPGPSPVGARVDLTSSLSGQAIRQGRVLRSHDTQRDDRVDAEACRRLSVRSLLCVPLSRSNEMLGVVAVNAPIANAFTDSDVATVTRLAEFLSVIIGSARDLHRTSNHLLELSARIDAGALPGDDTGRYLMEILHPELVSQVDARARIQEVLDDPGLISILFQPIVDLLSGSTVGVEALARFGAVPARPPDQWFDDAHTAGVGVELELVAIRRALTHLTDLPDDIAVTINAGPETITSSGLLEALNEIDTRRVVLELTERLAFDQFPKFPTALQRLRKAGIRIAVDDAGSGYSGLTHILTLAPEFIKLDRMLISGIDLDPVRRALVTSLVAFAAESGAEILAEGVETADELAVVESLGVRFAQGYHLGRPVDVRALGVMTSVAAAPSSRPEGR